MTIYTSRDYLPAAAGYTSNRAYWPHVYELVIFLHKILGYSIVGQTGLAINTPVTSLSITGATNASPIEITTSVAHGFSTGQSVIIAGVLGNTNANGTWVIVVTGTSTFTITSANGNGAYTGAGTVTAGSLYTQGLVTDGYGAGINFGAGVEKDVSIPISKRKVVAGDIGKMLVLKSSRYPNKNSGCFKISALNVGNSTTIALASSGTTTTTAVQTLPTGTINVTATANFPASGSIFVTTTAGIQTVTYTGKGATTFTGCTGGTGNTSIGGTVTNTIATLPQPTINVASTAGFPTAGTIFITLANNGTTQIVAYTGTTGTTFTGCTGGTGIMTVSDSVANLNRYNIDYRATENPPIELTNTIDWWLYEVENTASSSITNFATNNAVSISMAGINTTIAAGSNGVSLPTSTINVASTTPTSPASDPFPTPSGTIFVPTTTGTQTVTYTGTTGTTFTGCSGGTGTMSTGGVVWANQSPIKISGSTHGYSSGQKINISGVLGNTAANGNWIITVSNTPSSQPNANFTLNGSASNGGYTASGASRIEGYIGDSVSYNSRIILQSPHPSGWQVRIAVEPTSSNYPPFTVTTGYGGNSLGDFLVNGQHTHIGQFLDYNVSLTGFTQYSDLTTGGGFAGTTTSRMSIMGDDTGQAVFFYTRTVGATNNGMLMFGIPDNEPIPTPANVERIFSYGSIYNGSVSNSDFGNIRLKTDFVSNSGLSVKRAVPSITSITGWTTLDGTNTVSPLQSANAGDSPFILATEVLPLEVWAGVNCDIATTATTTPPFLFDQTYMGTCPLLRNGRTNFGTFVLTTEETTTRAVTAATNATPIQITTGLANALVTGQTVTIFGVLGNTAANGTFVVTVLNSTNFTLNGSVGNGVFAGATTIAVGSNGASLPQATINVASTTGFPTSGVIYVTNNAGGVVGVNYTGTNATQFTGCTNGSGVMGTGNAVTTGASNGCPRWIHLQNGIYLQWNGASGLNP